MVVIDIIQLFIPIATFAMGYFLTNIGYKRNRKLSIIREKFEKLYHPFYMMINELGTENEIGFAFDTENRSVLKPFISHLITNSYLATNEGQHLIWETRKLFVCCTAEGYVVDKEKEHALEKSIGVLFEHLLKEYIKSANALGYELGGAEAFTNIEK
jgi:hypothetical protein